MNKRDLFVVVADLDAENAVKTLLAFRQRSMGISLDFNPERYPQGDILRYSGRDSGCFRDAVDLLRQAQRTYRKALIIFDQHGSGVERQSAEEICSEIEDDLRKSGWPEDSAAVIVLVPELEIWVWNKSRKVSDLLGWKERLSEMREFLVAENLWRENEDKPHDPKLALETALRKSKVQVSARLFSKLAEEVSLQHCQDPSFKKLTSHLQRWFPATHEFTGEQE